MKLMSSSVLAVLASSLVWSLSAQGEEVRDEQSVQQQAVESTPPWWACYREGEIACVPYYDNTGAAIGYNKYICRNGVYIPVDMYGGC